MKKQLLFVMNNLNCGGAEKALISLLQTLDYSQYDVDLFLFHRAGLFLPKVPAQVRVLEEQPEYRYFDMPAREAVVNCMRRMKPGLALSRIRAGWLFREESNRARCEQKVWRHKSKAFGRQTKIYDAAIGFMEMSPIYYVIEKVNAKKKIGWIHTNYINSGMDRQLDQPYFKQLDHIVTVSEECADSLKRVFETESQRIGVVHNIVSPQMIMGLSSSEVHNDILRRGTLLQVPMVVTVARLSREKGVDLAIEACKLLVDRGCRLKWVVVGSGSDRQWAEYTALVEQLGLQGTFVLLGAKDNPYPYIQAAHVYVQPSRYEGRSIALDEAKILGKAIVATNFTTVHSQLTHGHNGWIVDIDPRSISEGVERLLEDEGLRKQFNQCLSAERQSLGSETEIEKLYEMLV